MGSRSLVWQSVASYQSGTVGWVPGGEWEPSVAECSLVPVRYGRVGTRWGVGA